MSFQNIQLYAYPQGEITKLKETMSLCLDYDLAEYRQLEQSVLSHDLFVNKIGQDFFGIIIPLAIGRLSEVIQIRNSELPKVLEPLKKIYSIVQNQGQLNSSMETLIYNFLMISHKNGYDVISASQLSWSYGD